MTRLLTQLGRMVRQMWTRITAHYYYARAKRKVYRAQMAHLKAGLNRPASPQPPPRP